MMKIDVRSKFALLFYANYLLLRRPDTVYQWILVIVLLLGFYIQGYSKKAIRYFIIFT